MDQYDILELIGEGSFGRVFKGRPKNQTQPGPKFVALKLIPKIGHSEREIKNLRQECKIQRELSHPNVVKMIDAFETVNELIAVTEFVSGGDLHRLFHKKIVEESRVRQICADLISACCYLHSHRVVHRDIKPQNVLVSTTDGIAKLCDFGFARNLGINTFVLTSIKGTPLYMAPELIEEKPYDHSADLWSVGCILYELLVGAPPFSTSSLFQLIKKVRYESINWSMTRNWSSECLNFLQGLLEKDSKKRLSWPGIFHHPFVAGRLYLEGCNEAFLNLTESQELAKEIQRQDRVRLLPGSSQTLLKLAQRYEEQKRIIQRRYSEVQKPFLAQPRRPSDLSALCLDKRNSHPSSSSLIKFPAQDDEVGWIEYLDDKFDDEDEEEEEYTDFEAILRHLCKDSKEVLERFITLMMSKKTEFWPDLIEELVSWLEFLLLNEPEEEEENGNLLSLVTCLLSRSLRSEKNSSSSVLIKRLLDTKFKDLIFDLLALHNEDLSNDIFDILNLIYFRYRSSEFKVLDEITEKLLFQSSLILLSSSASPNKVCILINFLWRSLRVELRDSFRSSEQFQKVSDYAKCLNSPAATQLAKDLMAV